MIAVDGYFEDEEQGISWHQVDEEVNTFITGQMKTTDTLLLGRKTYQIMNDFWPTKAAFSQDPEIADMMGSHAKVVFSRSMETATWRNTRLVKDNATEAVRKMKAGEGKDLLVLGSADLCKSLIKYHLIDEFRLMINPLTLGKGTPFFHEAMRLQLLKVKVFGNGNVLMCYRPGT